MTAPLHCLTEGTALDDALAATANRWQAHCLLELDGGRVGAHHVQPGQVSDAVVAAVLAKQAQPLAAGRRGLRTLGLLPGGAVISGQADTGETVTSVPLGGASTGCLWLVTPEAGGFDLEELARAADRVFRAHLDGLDQLVLDGTALHDCLRRGDAVPSRLVGRARELRLLALQAVDADPAALEPALRRSGQPHLGAARCGDALVVLLSDDSAVVRAERVLASLEAQGLVVRAALSPPVAAASRTDRARDQVLACLALGPAGSVAMVEEHRAELVLHQLRGPLATAVALVDDPLAALDDAASRDVDFRGSLLAWLEAHGDVRAAARHLGVHENTLRYRVRRALELLGTDLSHPGERLEMHLRLRLLP